ncbi:MAG: CBS domain-containing protein [Miltoncostaeaceae bacterium]
MAADTPDTGLSPQPLASLVQRVSPLRESDRLSYAASRMAEAGGGLPVANADGHLVGFLSERDLIGAMFPAYLNDLRHTEFLTKDFASLLRRASAAAERRVEEVMTTDVAAVRVSDSETHAAEIFLHRAPHTLPVVDDQDRVRGVVRIADVVQSLLEACGASPGQR